MSECDCGNPDCAIRSANAGTMSRSMMKCCTPGCPKRATGEDGHHCAEHQHERCAHAANAPYDADPAYATAAELLKSLTEISKDRAKEHGGVTSEWTRTAEVWSAMLGVKIEPHVAMAMMTANKCVRLALAPREDHFADGANYLALAWGVLNMDR